MASKVGFGPPDGLPNRSGLSRKRIFNALEASLTRLDTDYLDIYYLHREDHNTPLEVTVSAIGDLIRQGKIRYWGLSNYRGWRIAEVIRVAERLGVDKPVISQPLYNIVNRQAEVEQITAAAAYGLGVVPYSPLARGVLSGKYAPDVTPEAGSRAARQDKRILETEWRVESLRIAPANPAICPRAWRGDCRVRNRLGTEQRGRQLCDCRATYRGAVGCLHWRAGCEAHG